MNDQQKNIIKQIKTVIKAPREPIFISSSASLESKQQKSFSSTKVPFVLYRPENNLNFNKNFSRNLKALTSKNMQSSNSATKDFILPDILLKGCPYKCVKQKEKLLKGQNRLIYERLASKKQDRKIMKKLYIISPSKNRKILSFFSDKVVNDNLQSDKHLISRSVKNNSNKSSLNSSKAKIDFQLESRKNSDILIMNKVKRRNNKEQINHNNIKPIATSSIDSDKDNFDNIVFSQGINNSNLSESQGDSCQIVKAKYKNCKNEMNKKSFEEKNIVNNNKNNNEKEKKLINQKFIKIKKILSNSCIFKNYSISTNDTNGKFTSIKKPLH